MPIDPKKIEEWKRAAEGARRGWFSYARTTPIDAEQWGAYITGDRDTVGLISWGVEPIAALLAEREDVLLELGAARATIERHRPDLAGSDFRTAAVLSNLYREREEMLAVLRGIEWSAPAGSDGEEGACPICHRWRPCSGPPTPGFAHSPDCRLDALLRGAGGANK